MNKYIEALDYAKKHLDSKHDLKKVEVLQELVDKATPLKPQKEYVQYVVDGTYYSCPCCGYLIDKFCIMQDNNYKKIVIITSSYCSNCGQAIDWSDEDENTH